MRRFIVILLLFVTPIVGAQNELLAKNYFDQGEYEKALSIYTKLYQKSPHRFEFFLAMIQSNQQLERYSDAENLLIKKIKSNQKRPGYKVELGYNYALQNKDSLADIYYNEAIEYLNVNSNHAYSIGKTFEKYSLLDKAVAVYEKAMVLNSDIDYNSQLARIYGEQGDIEKMFTKYLDLVITKPIYKSTAEHNFSLYINEDPSNEANLILKKALLKKLQQQPHITFNELLSWLFIQQKEYHKAFIQEKAIYARMEDNDLTGMVELVLIAINDEDYKSAKKIVNFIIEKAESKAVILEGKQYLMTIALKQATKDDFPSIEKQYNELLDEFGRTKETYLLQLDYNEFLAFQYEKKDEAIQNLKNLLKENFTRFQEARIKMKLADILVLDEKFNQALIYYSQIQKKVKGDKLAQEARFKVAKTSYYKGDFEWSKVQLDVLKKSTSQLIANDAMQLSLIIKDNSLEDSTQTALKKYANADLLSLQKKEVKAIEILSSILKEHKGEKIEDEALLKLGKLYTNVGNFNKAEEMYLKLIQFYKEDILADDAHFLLAKLYENKLDQSPKAKEFYEQIIFNYADSIYFIEARKRFRMLRGDLIEQ
ncbi:MAG: tetratricopeptide repeat protein [Flavobacteriaceae bacterium]|nr:tetratricopeptide repeat protein [Flavobacteriaceae bacterium]